jgi:hypothetical protein
MQPDSSTPNPNARRAIALFPVAPRIPIPFTMFNFESIDRRKSTAASRQHAGLEQRSVDLLQECRSCMEPPNPVVAPHLQAFWDQGVKQGFTILTF